jgi:hypothetical protein
MPRYRVTLCRLMVSEVEIEATDARFAKFTAMTSGDAAQLKFVSDPVATRIEHRVPTAEAGRFTWQEVPRA